MQQARGTSWRRKRARFMDRWHARAAGRAQPSTGIVSQPEPRTVGRVAKGRQLVAGNFLFAGQLIEADGPWDIEAPGPAYCAALHGFGWLDDLAACGDYKARKAAQAWVMAWIDGFGRGRGPGWTPDLAGRRLVRWIGHALFILRGARPEQSRAFHQSLGQQTIFLSKRWHTAAPGLARFEALTGMIYAGLSLEGMEDHLDPALSALEADCATQVDSEGGIPTRNPEELLEVFTLLSWAGFALKENNRQLGPEHQRALDRMAPTLRALRHADGGLARFHGGGRGVDGRLDHALQAASPGAPSDGLHMGFGRLSAGRTSVIMDAAAPPAGRASINAHASTLAFELTSGRRPLVVSCGSGAPFGEDWRRAGRATPSHSTLALDGLSSSQLAQPEMIDGLSEERLTHRPGDVPWDIARTADGWRIEGGHDGWRAGYGLTHARTLELSQDGRALVGTDLLTTLSETDEGVFDRALDRRALDGVPFDIRFHLHPDADARLDMGGAAVSVSLRSGEVWVIRAEGAKLSLEPSVYLDSARLRPRGSEQIVLTGQIASCSARVRWAFSKAQDTPTFSKDHALIHEKEKT